VYNPNNGKITLYLDGWTDPAKNPISTITQYQDTFQSATNAYFTFFDMSASKSCYGAGGCGNQAQTHTFNSTLGWLMGFRLPLQPVFSSTWNTTATATAILGGGNTPQGVLNLYGTKYFIIVLDDFNQNHINNGLITITELSKSFALRLRRRRRRLCHPWSTLTHSGICRILRRPKPGRWESIRTI
jgi:hypothetical protein